MRARTIRIAMAIGLAATLAACGGGGGGGGGNNPPAAPPAPTGVSAVAGNAQVTVSWSAVSGATSYNVYWSTSAGVTKASGTKVAGATNPYVHGGCSNGTAYHYVVTAVNANGESAESAEVNATPVPPAPAAPAGVSATPGDAQVTVAWGAVSGAASYNLYWATTPGVTKANGTKIAGATSPYVHGSRTNGTTYYYVVTAVNAGGESASSAQVSAVASATPAPAAPTGLVATANDKQVALSWTAVTGAASYKVYRSTTAGVTKGTGTNVASPSSPSFTDPSLTNGTTYYYVVTALNSNGESTDSAQVSAIPVPPVPSVPTGVAAAPSDKKVTVSWSASAGADSYNIYWSTTPGVTKSNGTPIVGVPNPYDHLGRVNGTTYYYVVTAVNLGGESSESAQASATPEPPAPVAPTGVAAVGTDKVVTVTWTSVSGADSYNIYWSTTPGVTKSNGTKIPGQSSPYPHTGRTNGVTYYYVVTAVNGGGESGDSAQASATPMPGLPAMPTGVTATAGGAKVTVAWSAVTGAASYNVYRSLTSGGPGTLVGSPSSATFNDTVVNSGTTYFYVVTSVNLAGESPPSAEVSAVPFPVAFSISGTVGYPGGVQTGRIYVEVVPSGCSNCSANWGTSIASPGSYTIRGVTPGSYTVIAFMDTIGKGVKNATFPSGTSTTVNVTNASMSGVGVTLSDPTLPAPGPADVPQNVGALAGDGGAFFYWGEVQDANGLERVTSYDVSWGTDANASTGGGFANVPAYDNAFLLAGLNNGTAYRLKVRSNVGSTPSAWSPVTNPFTPAAGPAGNTVSGTVSLPSTHAGPLYVALGQPNGPPLYVLRIANPSASQAYSFSGVQSGAYSVYAILDQNANGQIDLGDLSNTGSSGSAPTIVVAGNVNNANVTLTTTGGARAGATTNRYLSSGPDNYSLGLRIDDAGRQVVKAVLVSGTGVTVPVDMPRQWGDHELWANASSHRPAAGDQYGFDVTYADDLLSTARIYATVSGVLDACPTNLTTSGTPNAPTFAWSAPTPAPVGWYAYRFDLNEDWSYGNTYWRPTDNALFPSAQTSALYNFDGTASSPTLGSGMYYWTVTLVDASSNSCSQQANYLVP
jgi:fibronectin type 3 domain-containing protein